MNNNDPEVKEFQAYLVAEAKSLNKDPQEYVKGLGEDGLKEAYKRFQAHKKKLTQKAAHGAKLNYFKFLKNQCAEDEEVIYYRKGGSVECGCKKKEDGGEVKKAGLGCSAVEKFKAVKKAGFGDTLIRIADSISGGGFKRAAEEKKKKLISSTKGPGTTKQPMEEAQRKNTKKPFKNDYSSKRVKDSEEDYLKGKTNEAAAEKCGGKVKKKAEGSKINKDCGGSAIAKFKAAKCGSKLKKHLLGGSLNGIPFYLKGKQLPTAPSVKERYSGGYRYLIPWMKKVRGPKTSMLVHPGEILLYVREVTPYYNDTTYVEVPEHTSFVDIKPRVASTNSTEDLNSPILDKNGWPTGHYKFKFNNSPEYEILKRRFNTAWNLAK